MENLHPLAAYRKRQAPQLSQSDLAGRLGVVRETVARWETGARRIDQDKLIAIWRMTGIPPKELRPDLAAVFGEPAE